MGAAMPRYRLIGKAFLHHLPTSGASSQRGGAMTGRVLLAIAILVASLSQGIAQFGDMPGLPGNSTKTPPIQCRELLRLRQLVDKHGATISEARERKTHPSMVCRMFRDYAAVEAKMLWVLNLDGAACGVPGHVNQQVRESHAKTLQAGKRICEAAGRPFRPETPPVMDDRLRPVNPTPRKEPWPSRVSQHRSPAGESARHSVGAAGGV
jgi:hypothetical protein